MKLIREEVLKLQDFDDLCDRAWFSRRWVVQEITLAQKALLYCGRDNISWNKFSLAMELFVEVETATHRLLEVMKKDQTFYHISGWFDSVSQLGASLLVDATGRLFRDRKDIGKLILAKERMLLSPHAHRTGQASQDSDSDSISDNSVDEEELKFNGIHATNGHRDGNVVAPTKGPKLNLKQQAEQTPSRVNQLAQ